MSLHPASLKKMSRLESVESCFSWLREYLQELQASLHGDVEEDNATNNNYLSNALNPSRTIHV